MTEGTWLSILEYARYRDISISTIRRYIKAERVRYKLDNGKYYIFVNDQNYTQRFDDLADRLQEDNRRLSLELKTKTEELEDLKSLVALYEQRKPVQEVVLPPLPE